MQSRSGLHDRRGFDFFIKLSLVLMVVSVAIVIIYSWKLGLFLLMSSCVSFITCEAMSAPPANRPEVFVAWARRQNGRRPVLLCLGDSLTHGNCSASFTPDIPFKLCSALGMDPSTPQTFSNPLWVVNAGQNSITTHTILNERLNKALACYPDFIMIMIGTNDVRAMYKKSWASHMVTVNDLPVTPTMQVFERNLNGIVNFIRQSSPMVQIGICTLPPLGENLNSRSNQLVREANDIIEQVAAADGDRCTVIPVFARLESHLEKKRRGLSLPVDYFALVAIIMNPLFHMAGRIFTWNRLSALVGNTILSDGVHLNETGKDEVVDVVVDWLLKKNVAKAIAVKS